MQLVAKLENDPAIPLKTVNPLSLVTSNSNIKFYIWPKDPCNQAVLTAEKPNNLITFINSTIPVI